MFANTGMVCFFSTTPAIANRGVRSDSRVMVSFISIALGNSLVLGPTASATNGGRSTPLAGQHPQEILVIFTDGRILLLELDRKSTRLNSSHVRISYAVFC